MARNRCDRCGFARWDPLAYEYPGHEMMSAADRGDIVLGGCVVEDDSPNWQCRLCGKPRGVAGDWTGADGPRLGEFAYFHQRLTAGSIPEGNDFVAVSEFALSFDGYAAFGSDAAAMARKVRQAFGRTGRLPDHLAVLRCCLFMEQRGAHHRSDTLDGDYVLALLDAIKAHQSRDSTESPVPQDGSRKAPGR